MTKIIALLLASAYSGLQQASGYTFISKRSLTAGREELPLMAYDLTAVTLPTEFDARTAWPNCSSISDIYDQAACGDCWAVGTITAATDRLCISTGNGGINQPRLSVEHMVGCCHHCGYGCGDGFPNYAWQWLAGGFGSPYGVVTGGMFGDDRFCSAYSLKPCNHYNSRNDTLPSCEKGPPDATPKCPTQCDQDSKWPIPFEKDIHKASKSYALPSDENQIMADIMKNGPVTAGFNVYSDWTGYTSGVYQATGGEELGGHVVRIIGWGVENGKKYWLCSNSFGEKWGDKGYFKILRGVGECGIEESVVAGLM